MLCTLWDPIMLRARRLRNFGSILSRSKRVSPTSSPNSRERLWVDPKMCSVGNNGSFHRDRSGRRYEAAHSPPSRTEGKNKWICHSITAHAHPRLCRGGGGGGYAPDPARETKNLRIVYEPPHPKTMFWYTFSVCVCCFFFCINIVMRSAFCFVSAPWTYKI